MAEIPREGKALLATIAWAEGTSSRGRNPYLVVYGYGHTIQNLSDHPAVTGEWTGKVLPPHYCSKAGLKPGCKSTASGAYQITKPTWLDRQLRKLYSPKSFEPDEQDNFCWFGLCASLKIPQMLVNGRVDQAIMTASRRWASFPASTSGQPKRSLAMVLAAYNGFLEGLR